MGGTRMPIFAKIQEQKDAFSKSELKIAQFILDQPEEVLKMTAQQVATAANSSSAAVIRLCKRLKVYGFPQLKIELSADLSSGELSQKIQPEVRKNEAIHSIKERLLLNVQSSLAETVEELEDAQISQLSQLVARTTRLLVFGVGASNLVAQDIAQKWGSIGTIVSTFNNLNDILPIVANANKDDLLWVISNSGETPEAVHALKIAKEQNVATITMTKKGSSTISELGDIDIHTSQPIELPGKIAATDSLMLQFMAIDIIFYDYVSRYYETSISKLEQSSKLVKNYKKNFYKK
ncbi:hypothetical protein RV02_GL001367 [Enterococcus gilvus]|nr:hypothetical protein RV02_GL001367 [Enterococcus gilvus]